MEDSPHIILNLLLANSIDKDSAVNQLLTIIENSTNEKLRISSIDVLDQIKNMNNYFESKGERIFQALEQLSVSDSNDIIRIKAVNFLLQNFPEKAFTPMLWILHNDESPKILSIVVRFLISHISLIERKSDLVNLVKNIQDIDFRICLSENVDFPILKEIIVNYFCLIYLKKAFWRLKFELENCRIISIDFTFKDIAFLPSPIKYLTYLKKLVLKYNQLTTIPTWIKSLKSLEILNLNVNNINRLPDSIGQLNNLRELTLWKNELTFIPDSITNLHNLEILNLRLNNITFLPAKIGDLKSLRILNLHDNKLTSLPESIMNLNSLQNLNLSWNSLTMIPQSITRIRSLKYLDLERNELSTVSDNLEGMKSLISLNLNDNHIKEFPKDLKFPSNLKFLNLSRNELENLPNGLYELPKLEELYIGQNNFEEIPRCIKLLRKKGVKITE